MPREEELLGRDVESRQREERIRAAGASAPHPHPEKSGHGHNEGESAERARAVRSPAQREGTESPEQGVAVAPSGGQPGTRA